VELVTAMLFQSLHHIRLESVHCLLQGAEELVVLLELMLTPLLLFLNLILKKLDFSVTFKLVKGRLDVYS